MHGLWVDTNNQKFSTQSKKKTFKQAAKNVSAFYKHSSFNIDSIGKIKSKGSLGQAYGLP